MSRWKLTTRENSARCDRRRLNDSESVFLSQRDVPGLYESKGEDNWTVQV
jgi:hypothetical protein